MPRTMRLEMPGALAHIMAHSIDGKNLFEDDEDRVEFLRRLATGLELTGYQCFAWTLMDNHYHLLVRTNHLPMAKLMRSLNSGYARYYNIKHKRSGYLFQNRFKSILCQDQDYAAQLVKYIHLNPMRAGKVKTLEQLVNWTWCGHGYLLGKEGSMGGVFQNRAECLRRFGEEEQEAIRNYLNFLSEGYSPDDLKNAGQLPETEKTEVVGSCKGWPAVIGDPDFVKQAMEKHRVRMHRLHRKADYSFVLEKTAEEVCRRFGITKEDLMHRGRKDIRTRARADFCYQLYIEELLPLTVIADFLKTTIPPVASLVRLGAKHKKENVRKTLVVG